jgi:hypothetical protein
MKKMSSQSFRATPALGVEIVVSEVSSKEKLTTALTTIPEGVEAIFALPTTLLFANIGLDIPDSILRQADTIIR